MGQVVSYLFGCLCGEAEKEESLSDPDLQACPLIAPPKPVSCFGSSADIAIHQFMVQDSEFQDVENPTQVHHPRWNSCSDSSTNGALVPIINLSTNETWQHDLVFAPSTAVPIINLSNTNEALQHDQVIAPSTVVPSINLSTNEALQHDLVIPPSTVVPFPSIDQSTNEALQHDIVIAPSTMVPFPSIYLSTNEALQHDLVIAPSTVVPFPSIDLSTNEALQHDLVIAPSAVVPFPSIDLSTNEALQHDIVITPSIVVSNIGSSTSELFHQIDVVDSIIQGLEDERKIYQLIKDWKRQEPREEEEEREVEKPCIRVVKKERKIKHYNSSQKILLVGEGDFSFSACLALAFRSASNMVATSLDSEEFLHKNYKKAKSNICALRRRGCKVMHGLDATKMANNSSLNGLKFDRIIYNFPLAGFFPGASRKSQLKRNRRLIRKFLDNAKTMFLEHGEIHITHKSCGFFLEWNMQLLASNVGLRLVEEEPFDFKDYEGYNTKYGFGGDQNFNCNPSKTYKFGLKLQKAQLNAY